MINDDDRKLLDATTLTNKQKNYVYGTWGEQDTKVQNKQSKFLGAVIVELGTFLLLCSLFLQTLNIDSTLLNLVFSFFITIIIFPLIGMIVMVVLTLFVMIVRYDKTNSEQINNSYLTRFYISVVKDKKPLITYLPKISIVGIVSLLFINHSYVLFALLFLLITFLLISKGMLSDRIKKEIAKID